MLGFAQAHAHAHAEHGQHLRICRETCRTQGASQYGEQHGAKPPRLSFSRQRAVRSAITAVIM
jgi:hypothetical protein